MSSPDSPAAAAPAAVPKARVHVVWRGEERFEFGRDGKLAVTLDGTGQQGPSPFDGLLGALGSCPAVDVLGILAKRRTPAESLEVEVVATRADGVPRRLVGAELRFRISGRGIDRVDAERAIELAVTKYCSVRDSLDRAIPITWNLELGD
jgi:putative redox protein